MKVQIKKLDKYLLLSRFAKNANCQHTLVRPWANGRFPTLLLEMYVFFPFYFQLLYIISLLFFLKIANVFFFSLTDFLLLIGRFDP